MNKKIVIAVCIAVLFSSVVMFSLFYHHIGFDYIYTYEVWKDTGTDETVLNGSIDIIAFDVYFWKTETRLIFTNKVELFRSQNTSAVLQCAINQANRVYIRKGNYTLSTTVYLDSNTQLYASIDGKSTFYFNPDFYPAFATYPNATNIVFSGIYLNLSETK